MSRIVRVHRIGGPEALELEEAPLPQPRGKQVRVRVHAAGVAFGDVMRRKGVLSPLFGRSFTPGYDIVGEVEEHGDLASPFASEFPVGARVACLLPKTGFGGYAEHVCVPAKSLVPVPNSLSSTEAVALGLNYITAYQILHRVTKLQRGQSLLVHGAAGGVGTAVLQLAREQGIQCFGTASAAKHALVRSLGGTPIDYRSVDFAEAMEEHCPDGVDAVIDGIGGAHLSQSIRCLRRGGTLVALGVSGDVDKGLRGVIAGLAPFLGLKLSPNGKRVCFYGITATPGAWPKQCREDWAKVFELASAPGAGVTPVVGAALPLSQVSEAHRLLEGAKVHGKVVLDMLSKETCYPRALENKAVEASA